MPDSGRTLLVVDASVAVKWFVDEEDSIAARSLVNTGAELLAPDVFTAELGNVLLKKVRRGEMGPNDVPPAIASTEFIVSLRPSLTLAADAFEIATRFNRSFYDALYVALAVQQSCQMATADEKLVNGMGPSFRDRFLLLTEVPGSQV